ncbi:MAG TPA: exopolysaccharide biosynthesis polyprenyl glycosylphosphotransferase [Actinocrinis sp.]|nr:exopolysaccharide biosynthesis polyprenyl glycosylphosphotransferase [Actinocrinis sp.]
MIYTDGVAAAAAAAGASFWRVGGSDASGLSLTGVRVAVCAVVPLWLAALWLCGAYGRHTVTLGVGRQRRLLSAAGLLAAAASASGLLVDSTLLYRREVVAVLLAAALTPLLRRLSLRLPGRIQAAARAPRRALLVGPGAAINDFIAQHRPGDLGPLSVAASFAVDSAEAEERALTAGPSWTALDSTPEMVRRADCDLVIALTGPELDGAALRRMSWRLREIGVDLALAPILTTVAAERIDVSVAGGLPLLHIRPPALSGPGRVLKDLTDRALALVLLLLLSPLLLVLAAVVRATSPGPALFRQKRVGLNGTQFTCFKFRTMVVNAEQLKAQLEHLNENRDGLLFKIRDDPRLTKVGAVLRRYSLDELPQLLNVLGGSMSLVGPRPPLPAEVARYNEEVWRRLYVKPGLTGLWQVSGRSSLSWAESVRLDLNYVENWSPALDATILLRTTTAVVRGTGAF